VCSCCVRPLLGAAFFVVLLRPARLFPKTCEALPLAPCACVCRRAASSPRLPRCRSTRASHGVLFRLLASRADGLVPAGLVLRDSEANPLAFAARADAGCCHHAPRRLLAASVTLQALTRTAWCPFFACPPRAPSDWCLLASRRKRDGPCRWLPVCMRCCRRAPCRLSAAFGTLQALARTAWCPF
jgi:hypothetical protein